MIIVKKKLILSSVIISCACFKSFSIAKSITNDTLNETFSVNASSIAFADISVNASASVNISANTSTDTSENEDSDFNLDSESVADSKTKFNNRGNKKSNSIYTGKLKSLLNGQQWLEARYFLKKIDLSQFSDFEWKQIRWLIHSHPQLGWDVVKSWDQSYNQPLSSEDIELQNADKNMLAENFYSAFITYQKLAVQILKMPKNLKDQNLKLYWTLVHSMARAAYGAKNFELAFQYYQKIPVTYELFRQVQFEKMWAAYRAEKIEMAIGAVASQASAYFSSFFEPETYLLQFYIFKRMCRDFEISKIKAQVYELKKKIDQNKIKDSDWLSKDIETLLYKQILVQSKSINDERKYLLDFIRQRKDADIKRIKEQMDDVISFVEILSTNKKALKPIYNKFKVSSVINSQLEKWNVEDTEEWVDDLGKHIFIGNSECKK